ncbi:MAG: Gfo/Idh/MocA family oxidoreductase [Candidatus Bathyarchaeia archaeon]
MIDPIGAAIVGAGQLGGELAVEYLAAQRRGKVNLLKVCDSSIAALGALLITKETSSIKQEMLTQDIHELLDNPDIAIVHIATPIETHYELAEMALEAGKNVLVEKPMTLSSHESYHLVDLAKERGLLIEISHPIRFNRALQVASEMLSGGELGKLYYVKVHWTDQNSFPDEDIIFGLGHEPLDVLNLLLGAWPEDVSCVGRAYRNSSAHNDVAYILAEYRDKVFAHIELSWLHARNVREVTIVGAEGSLMVDCLRQLVAQPSRDTRFEIPVTPSNAMVSQIEHFADRVARGDCAIDLTGPRTLETLEAISRSVSEKKLTAVANLKYQEEMLQLTQDAKTTPTTT